MPDSRASDGDHMIDLQTLDLIALQLGLGIRRCGSVDDPRYDMVVSDDGTVVSRALTRDQIAAELALATSESVSWQSSR
jgi:hypothetical protein